MIYILYSRFGISLFLWSVFVFLTLITLSGQIYTRFYKYWDIDWSMCACLEHPWRISQKMCLLCWAFSTVPGFISFLLFCCCEQLHSNFHIHNDIYIYCLFTFCYGKHWFADTKCRVYIIYIYIYLWLVPTHTLTHVSVSSLASYSSSHAISAVCAECSHLSPSCYFNVSYNCLI